MEMLRFENAIYQERVSMKGIVCYYPKISDIEYEFELEENPVKLIPPDSTVLIIVYKYHNQSINVLFKSRADLQSAINELDIICEVRPIH